MRHFLKRPGAGFNSAFLKRLGLAEQAGPIGRSLVRGTCPRATALQRQMELRRLKASPLAPLAAPRV